MISCSPNKMPSRKSPLSGGTILATSTNRNGVAPLCSVAGASGSPASWSAGSPWGSAFSEPSRKGSNDAGRRRPWAFPPLAAREPPDPSAPPPKKIYEYFHIFLRQQKTVDPFLLFLPFSFFFSFRSFRFHSLDRARLLRWWLRGMGKILQNAGFVDQNSLRPLRVPLILRNFGCRYNYLPPPPK